MSHLDDLLKPALELAIAVAREGEVATPRVEAPRALRPMLRFQRLPARALEAARKALEEDDGFRERVADVADEGGLGRAAYLFVARPDGWDTEFAELAGAAEAASASAAEEREERSARRRLQAVEERARRAEDEAARLRDELAAAREALIAAGAQLTEERAAREAASAEAEESRRRIRGLEAERDAAHRRASTAASRLATLEQEVADLRAAAAPAPPDPGFWRDEPPDSGGPSLQNPDFGAVAAAVDAAARAAAELGAALATAAGLLSGPPPAADDRTEERVERRPAPPSAPARLPVPLPPGIFDDSPEAVEFLVRVPDAVLLVDGYNASLGAWPGLGIAEQRRRLVDALEELGSRAGVHPHVVFDGSEVDVRSEARTRRCCRVTFTPTELEADDLIIELVESLPPAVPVVVASDDQRVRREVARRGANVVSQQQLFSVLRRER